MKVTLLIALFDKRSPDRLPNRCVHIVLHSEKTNHLFGDCRGPDAEKRSTERVYCYVAKKVFFWPIQILNLLFHFYHKLHVLISDVALLLKLLTCYFNLNKLFKLGPSVKTTVSPQ